ncbi:MAG: cob(I)yrinic acid a,c-diamide adenosyltransferase [Candidatus Pacebacteria bacterium]|nr:cob(I)yrinic acid a,c-diamide adenosyltransferase [Candidatus Paceibacterota bacterium]
MLYTRKGDGGTTKTFGCDQRISKSSSVAEALGSLDETNSFLGLVRAKTAGMIFKTALGANSFSDVVLDIQQNLFIVQAEVAGSTLSITADKITKAESIVDEIEKVLPPIKSFFLSGATEEGALFDVARTLSRRAERRVVAVKEEGKVVVSAETMTYLNRLSSLLYALARISSHIEGAEEIKPNYK